MAPEHVSFLHFVVETLRTLIVRDASVARRLEAMRDALLAVAVLDLEPAREVLLCCYSARKGGREPRDPVAMLRAFLLMLQLGFVSFHKWAEHLDGHRELCVLCGFAPDYPPPPASFYDFCHRLLDGPPGAFCRHVPRPSDGFRGARRRREQSRAPDEGRVAHEVRSVLQRLPKVIRSGDLQERIETILMRCAVVPSARTGLLGSLERLAICGDGSVLESGANGRGKALCSCREEGHGACDCARSYSDPSAQWGWDSTRERFYFGHRLHTMTCYDDGLDLPVHLSVAAANELDSVLGTNAVAWTHQWFAELLPRGAPQLRRLRHRLRRDPLLPVPARPRHLAAHPPRPGGENPSRRRRHTA